MFDKLNSRYSAAHLETASHATGTKFKFAVHVTFSVSLILLICFISIKLFG